MNVSRYVAGALFFFCFHVQNGHGKFKILGLMPYNGKSHFDFAEVLFEELARRGNDVTVLSHFPKKVLFKNYRDISMASKISDAVHSISMEDISSRSAFLVMNEFFKNGLNRVCHEGLSHPNVQKLMNSKDQYDVVITEMFNADCFLGFVHKFGSPLVSIRTSSLSTWLVDRTGNPDNPAYVPGTTSGNPSRMSFLQRVRNTVYYVVYKVLYRVYDVWCEEVARQHFGQTMPSLGSIARNTSLYLVNSHFVHQYAKPLMTNVKYVGGLHVKEPKPLKDDLENWISGARHGLIYLNLGSMLNPSSMAKDKRLAFLESFSRLPHRVLMKWDSETIPGLPNNVKLTTWAPQNDVLHHPNVKLFITHGGMLGTVEAVHAGVPLIVIPFFGDQLTNAVLLEERGLGLVLRYTDITHDLLNKTLQLVLYDPRYSRRAKELSAVFRDRPVPPLEEAAYWVEYVARHKGLVNDLMHSPSLDLALYQYLLLDILTVLLLGILVTWLTVRIVARFLVTLIIRRLRRINETKKNS